jgi:hypothetical protein
MDKYFQRILFRFETLFGSQKTKAVFNVSDESWSELSAAWEQYLRETDPAVIRAALASLAESPPEWPPALGEFIRLCKQFNRPEHRAALPPPPHAPTDVGRQMQNEIRNVIEKPGYDYLMWAKQPGSAKAVELLVRGAREDRRLRDILDHLIATDGRDCRGEEARRAIRALPASVRNQLAPA